MFLSVKMERITVDMRILNTKGAWSDFRIYGLGFRVMSLGYRV